jgi:hypothetical protein
VRCLEEPPVPAHLLRVAFLVSGALLADHHREELHEACPPEAHLHLAACHRPEVRPPWLVVPALPCHHLVVVVHLAVVVRLAVVLPVVAVVQGVGEPPFLLVHEVGPWFVAVLPARRALLFLLLARVGEVADLVSAVDPEVLPLAPQLLRPLPAAGLLATWITSKRSSTRVIL